MKWTKTTHCKSNIILVCFFSESFHCSDRLWKPFKSLPLLLGNSKTCLGLGVSAYETRAPSTHFLSWALPLFSFDLHLLSSDKLIRSLLLGEWLGQTLHSSANRVHPGPSEPVQLLRAFSLGIPSKWRVVLGCWSVPLARTALNDAWGYMIQRHTRQWPTGRGIWKLLPELGQTPKWHLYSTAPLQGQRRWT